MRFLIIVILWLFTSGSLFSQFRLENWKAHSSRVDVNCSVIDNKNNIWCGTSGGIFRFNYLSETETVYTNIESLLSNQISAISFNSKTGEIYAGTSDGIIEILKDNQWIHISDIKNQQFSNSEIKTIVFNDSSVFIGGSFGFAIFDPVNLVFKESVLKIGSLPINTPVNKILTHNGRIWVATDEGLASSSFNNFLPNPQSWEIFTTKNGLYQNKIKDIAICDDSLYLMSDRFLLKYDGLAFKEFAESMDNYFKVISITGSDIYYVDWFKLSDKQRNIIPNDYPALISGMSGGLNSSGEKIIVLHFKENGIGYIYNGQYKEYLPNCPLINSISDMTVDAEGNLWIATGVGGNGRGFAKFDGKTWYNFTAKSNPEFKDNSYHKIAINGNGTLAISNFGAGLLIGEPTGIDTYSFKLMNEKNSEFRGLSQNGEFIVAGCPVFDINNHLWVANLGEISTGPALLSFSLEDTNYVSNGYQNPRAANQRTFMSLDIDFWGTKWVGGNNPTGTGLMYYNEMGTFDDKSDDIAGVLSSSNTPNLSDNINNVLVVDKVGYVWIGTPRGVSVVVNPSQVLNGNLNNLTIRSLSRLIGEINVNDIMVDALNNKWIATSNGVWVLNPEASDTIAYINKGNSALPDNDILSISTNPNNGTVYFATKFGLYEAKSLSVAPVPDYDIRCYPQPFNPAVDKELIIDGLADFSEVRILTAGGELINSLNTSSRKTIWDGMDKNGKKVKSGIYLLVATSASSKVSSVQKIAIITDE